MMKRDDNTLRQLLWLVMAALAVWLALVASILCAYGATPAQDFYAAARGQPGITAYAATCQSAVETGYWQSELWRRAYNGAGIKAPPEWRAAGKPYIRIASREYSNGKYITRESYFRRYGSRAAFLADYAAKIRKDYPYTYKHSDNFLLCFAGLYRGRLGSWATDRKYFEKLTRMAVRLAPEIFGPAWHDKLLTAYEYARNELEPWQREIIKGYL